jgi:hypothetical protein
VECTYIWFLINIEGNAKYYIFETTVLYKRRIKKFVKLFRTDQIHFRCQVLDWNKEIRNEPNLKEIYLQETNEEYGCYSIKLEQTAGEEQRM